MKRLIKLAVAAVVAVILGFVGLIAYAKIEASRITLPALTPNGSTVVLAGDGKTVLGHIASANAGKQLTDSQVPALIRQTHMAAEDRGFYVHGPISLPGMAVAIVKDAAGLSFEAGGSTITQQQAKKYVGSEKSIGRKIDELPYAYRLENDYSKDQILDMYVNSNYYGRGAYGVEDAAQTWFGVSASSLNDVHNPLEVARAAFLAALIQEPSYFAEYTGKPSHLTHAKEIWNRTLYVLGGLSKVKGVPADQMVPSNVEKAAEGLLPLTLTDTLRASGSATDGDPYVINYVHDEMVAWQTQVAKSQGMSDDAAAKTGQSTADEMLARGGLTIQLSIDPTMQTLAVDAHRAELSGSTKSGVIILNPRDGGVLAMSGGRDYSRDPFNYAMYASRPPGSTMKPFVLADAVSQGISVNSVFAAPKYIQLDGPPIWADTRADAPGCELTLANALAESNNVVYAEAISGQMTSCQDRSKVSEIVDYPVTPSSVASLMRKAGADSSPVPDRTSPAPLSIEPRLAIGGTIQLSPLKLAVMAGTLADGGVYHKPYVIDRITASGGQVIFTHDAQSQRVLDQKSAAIVDQVLTGVFTHGTAVHDQVSGHPLAGKTGTTDSSQGDSWMFAFNADNPDSAKEPAMVCAGWAGSNPNLEGADVGRVCQNFFGHALAGRPTVDFPPADLNAGRHVGLSQSPVAPTTTRPQAPAPSTSRPEPKQATPTPTAAATSTESAPTTTRSVPPPEQSGSPVTGTAAPPGNPTPPGQQPDTTPEVSVTNKQSEAP